MSELDRLFAHLIGFDQYLNRQENSSYPPYNIIKVDDNTLVVSLAVAGFSKDNIEVNFKEGELVVKGKPEEGLKELHYLHKGIATRKFEQKFTLDKYLLVDKVKLDNGMLHIKLVRQMPEHMKSRSIPIDSSDTKLLS